MSRVPVLVQHERRPAGGRARHGIHARLDGSMRQWRGPPSWRHDRGFHDELMLSERTQIPRSGPVPCLVCPRQGTTGAP